MQTFFSLFKPYYTFVLFLTPVVVMFLIPLFDTLIKKAGALAGLIFGFFYIFLVPMGLSSSNAMTIIFPATFIVGAFLVTFLQRQHPSLASFWYSLLFFVMVYIILFVVGYLTK